MVVNKTELCEIIGTSIPTLDKLLRRYENFPVMDRGNSGKEYKFDADAVIAFLAEREAERVRAGAERDELMRQYSLPVMADTEKGLSPGDLLQLAKLRQIERRESIEAGFLVQVSEVRKALFNAFSDLRRDMASAVRQALRQANIPESVVRTVEASIADAQRKFVAKTQAALRSSDTESSVDSERLI